MPRSSCPGPSRARRPGGPSRSRTRRRTFRPLFHERLEDRTLLASATLSISSSGALEYLASTGVTNTLAVSLASSTYTFTDTESITLGSGTTGWTTTGDTAKGPSSTVSSITINTLDGNDSVTITSVGVPTNIAFNDNQGNTDSVTLGGNTNGAQSVAGDVTVSNAAGTTALTVNDTSDTTARTLFLSDGTLANLVPFPIAFGSANLSSLTIMGSNALGTLNVNATNQGPVAVTARTTTPSREFQITIVVQTPRSELCTSFLSAVNVSERG